MPSIFLTEKLIGLTKKVWNIHDMMLNTGLPILNNTCPILYFGNSKEYERSNIRIVTASLNPSEVEFIEKANKSPNINLRFPNVSSNNPIQYLEALDRYYMHNPYVKWFNNFEPYLNGLNASYYSCCSPKSNRLQKNRVLHTDIISPSATAIGWSKIPKEDQKLISAYCHTFWKELVCILKPHLIILSAGIQWYKQYGYTENQNDDLQNLKLDCQCSTIKIPTMIISNQQVPGGIGTTDVEKIRVGSNIRKEYFPTSLFDREINQ